MPNESRIDQYVEEKRGRRELSPEDGFLSTVASGPIPGKDLVTTVNQLLGRVDLEFHLLFLLVDLLECLR